MISLLIIWVVNAVALYITAHLVPDLSIRPGTEGLFDSFAGALILAVINKIVRPILVFFTLPLTFLTLGLFYFVILGFTFWIMTLLVPGIKTHGFFPCIIGGVVFGILGWFLHLFFK